MGATDEDTYLVLLFGEKSSRQCEDDSYFRHLCADDTLSESHYLDCNDVETIEKTIIL